MPQPSPELERSAANMDAISDLQSFEQSQLLDIIDQLRRQNPDADMHIPQIVVCGDTSSGKSSVLEAIAGIRFPVGHKAVTKFPTEIVLRHSPQSSMTVKLIPAKDRSEEQKQKIQEFKFETDTTDLRRIDHFVPEAEEFLESIEESGAEFWGDLLSAEVCGPSLPHLTVVDLPGLIHFSPTDNRSEDDIEDGRRIQEMTVEYISNPRAVVLAVVSAINDTRNQEVLSLVCNKRINARGRTLGIITKPDRVSAAKDEQDSLVALARNEEIRLGLGWHVLRNLAHDEAHDRRAERDEIERKFFSSAMWADISPELLGIKSLRKKLSKGLFNCIKRDLPMLLKDMQAHASRCARELEQLGEGRKTPRLQREYLSGVTQNLHRLIEAALEGHYSRAEFSTFFDGASQKHLRHNIREQSERFAGVLRDSGKQYWICTDESSERASRSTSSSHVPIFVPPYTSGRDTSETKVIGAVAYCTELAKHIRTRRGKHLKDNGSEAVQDIFRQQSVRWEKIAREYETACFSAVIEFVHAAVVHVAGDYTGVNLFEHHLDRELDRRGGLLGTKVTELLWPYKTAQPMTYHPHFSERTSKDNADTYAKILQGRDDLAAAADALDQAGAYYHIAVDTFIDNLSTLAIERWLLHDLADLLPPDRVWTMSDEDVAAIAAEPQESQLQRTRLSSQLEVLENAIRVCRRHARQGGSIGMRASQTPSAPVDDSVQSSASPRHAVSDPQLLNPTTTPQRRRPRRRVNVTPPSPGEEDLAEQDSAYGGSPRPASRSDSKSPLRKTLVMSSLRRASSSAAGTDNDDEEL